MSEIVSSISPDSSKQNTGSKLGFNSFRSSNRSISENHALNESFAGIVTSFTVYKLLSEIIKPFTAMEVYRKGLIDANGNLLKTEAELNGQEKSALTPFVRLVIGIKRLVQALPANRLKADFGYIQTAAKAMAFECTELGGDKKLFLEELEKALDVLLEEGEAVATSGGVGNEMGGTFLNPQVGEENPALAGYTPPMGLIRRKTRKIKQ